MFPNSVEMASPLEWKSDYLESWYFKNQINLKIWTEYQYDLPYANYTQISVNANSVNGSLEVILMKQKDFIVKLSDGFWCLLNPNSNRSCLNTSPGFWLKKKGIRY